MSLLAWGGREEGRGRREGGRMRVGVVLRDGQIQIQHSVLSGAHNPKGRSVKLVYVC